MVGVLCVCNITGKHESGCERIDVFAAGGTESTGDFFKHHAESCTVSSLLCSGADFFIVEKHCGRNAVGTVAVNNSVKHRKCGCDVVKPGRSEKILVKAAEHGLFGVVNAEIVAQNLLRSDSRQFCQLRYKISVLVEILLNRLANREHVLIGIQFNTLVNTAVHVNRKVGNCEDRFFKIHKAAFGSKHIVTLKCDHAGSGERSVKPCVVNHAAVGLDAELCAASGDLFGIGLYIIAGPVNMTRCKTKVFAGHIFAADMKCNKHGAEAFYIVVSALFKFPRFILFQRRKPGFVHESNCLRSRMVG